MALPMWLRSTAVLIPLAAVGLMGHWGHLAAETLRATPATYRSMLHQLKPGDVMLLSPGIYRDTLPLHGLAGTPEAPITIQGPPGPEEARFLGRQGANTVSLLNASYLVIDSLVLDGQGLQVDGVKAEGHAQYAHHITLSNLTIINHDADQSIAGISAHCPAWSWIIRGNVIDGAGTGMYLGASDGSAPFVGATIERNVVRNTLGYNIQIKHQVQRPSVPGMPQGRQTTTIRRNTFEKGARAATGANARPNLLVGHYPIQGPGSTDRYVIYGNLFFDNPTEALFQGEGNLVVYNNLFVNPRGDAIHIQPHNHKPREILLFHNTVVARDAGVRLIGMEPGFVRVVEGNAIFAGQPMQGTTTGVNFEAGYPQAQQLLISPENELAGLDLAPRTGALLGAASLAGPLATFPDAAVDYRGAPRKVRVFGACQPRNGCR